MAKILTKVRKKKDLGNEDVFTGYITIVTDKGKYLYSKFSGIFRTNREDALNDAITMKKDIIGE